MAFHPGDPVNTVQRLPKGYHRHTIDGKQYDGELHIVHKAPTGKLAVNSDWFIRVVIGRAASKKKKEIENTYRKHKSEGKSNKFSGKFPDFFPENVRNKSGLFSSFFPEQIQNISGTIPEKQSRKFPGHIQ